MAKKATRIKADTYQVSYQTREEVESAIKNLGDLQRELIRQETLRNDEKAIIDEKFAPVFTALKDSITAEQKAIQAYCESNRDKLTNNGKTKTGNFNTGEVQWRLRPVSVGIRGVDTVLEALKKWGLTRMIRTKEEINKEAILAEPNEVIGIAGITLKSAGEDFIIKPFENEVK